MTTPEHNANMNQTYRLVSRAGKLQIGTLVVAIILIALAAWFAKPYLDKSTDGKTPSARPVPQAPSVVLHVVEETDLAAGREYVGRVESVQTVLLRPQVSGQIAEVHFKEGSAVKAGQVLFTLDSKSYQATVELRKADLAKAQANYDQALKYEERLKAADKRSVSASDLDTAQSNVLQGKATIEQAKASLKLAQIDLEYTKITAPIAGQIGRAAFTKGNYVTPSSGVLANIVQTNPIRVSFALPDRDYLDSLEAFQGSSKSVYNATIRLSNGEAYPLSGERDFEENAMDDQTGTMMVRLRFNNDRGILIPGSMVRVATKPVKKHVALIMPQEAILADAQGDYVYVVDSNNVAHQRRITLGVEAGSMREVASGLEAGEKIVMRGLQSVRPESPVSPVSTANGNGAKTPAERAMESAADVIMRPSNTGSSADVILMPEGKN